MHSKNEACGFENLKKVPRTPDFFKKYGHSESKFFLRNDCIAKPSNERNAPCRSGLLRSSLRFTMQTLRKKALAFTKDRYLDIFPETKKT